MSATEPRPSCEQASILSPGFADAPNHSPNILNVYSIYDYTWGAGTYVIGERRNEPLYMCACHSRLSSSPPIVLHSGPDKSFPPLASVEWRTFSNSFYIDLPPLEPSIEASTAREEVKSVKSGYRFGIEVGSGNVREHFEWQSSEENIIQELGGESSGWKLVRLASGSPGKTDVDATICVPSGDVTDNHEVVAVWARNHGNLVGKFRFIGVGSSGSLGKRWEIAALVTFCAILERIRRHNPNLAVAATAPPC